jgi:hypothetical protein
MKLPFMLKFPWGEETHFIEKLWALGINQKDKDNYIFNSLQCNIDIDFFSDFTPKLHTIRNASDRFKVGQFVQPFIWTYKPYKKNPNPLIPAQFDFMPPIKIVSKQRFDLDKFHGCLWPFIDENEMPLNEVSNLAQNDGFNNDEHFFQYFNKPVENMEIRHFTHLTY